MYESTDYGTLKRPKLYLDRTYVNAYLLFMLSRVVILQKIAVKKVTTSALFRETSKLFLNADVGKAAIIHAGEQALVELYGGMQDELLDLLRFRRL